MKKNLTYFVRTYGCQANIRDGESINGMLESMKFKKADSIQTADIVILNTCAVRERAEKKVFGEIGFLQNNRLHNKKFILGVCGCMPHEQQTIQRFSSNNQVDFIFGTKNINQLPEIIANVIKNKKQVINVCESSVFVDDLPTKRNSKIKAFVNVMYGCNKFCSYCIVPFTRGRIVSRPKQDVIKEIKSLVAKGYKEVTLLGQNVNSYGADFKDNTYCFADLLADVAETNIPRIRFCTSNPWNFSKKIIDTMAEYKNIMPYVHLPIQSGDEEILKKMNRFMTINDYLEIVEYLRKKIKYCAISTDIIVGYPNETHEQFNHTLDIIKKIKFDNVYAFIYSKRQNTVATLIEDTTSAVEKQKRLAALNELIREHAKERNKYWLHKTVEVLVEGFSKTNKEVLTGYSPQWKVVNFTGSAKIGQLVKVKIQSVSRFSLNGVMVQ